MIKDKDVNLYLKKRQEVEAPNHHDLLPIQLREERLKQLKLDNLIGPELKKVFDTQIRSFDNYQLNLREFIFLSKMKKIKKLQLFFFSMEGDLLWVTWILMIIRAGVFQNIVK